MPKSPLRYPGGKQKAIPQIAHYLPQTFKEFREPFVGGGSVLFYILQQQPELPCWINDFNQESYYFWLHVKTNLPELVEQVSQIKREAKDGRALFDHLASANTNTLSPSQRAVRFFVLNRITFSGTIESGGYSQASFEGRFTESSIQRLSALQGCLDHLPFLGTREEAEKRIIHLVAMDPHNFIDFCVLLSGDFIPGQIATVTQILADTQDYPVPGAVRIPTN